MTLSRGTDRAPLDNVRAVGSGGQDLARVEADELDGLVLLRLGRGAAETGGLPQAIAVAGHGQDADVVGEAVQQRAGEPLGFNTDVQSSNGRLEVTIVEPRS
jgi:hypothetical protein